MITPMKKISIILLAGEKEKFLKETQKSGLMEIIKDQEKIDKPLEEKIELLAQCRRAIEEIRREQKNQPSPKKIKQLTGVPIELLSEFDSLHEDLTNVSREIDKLKMDEEKLQPWGHFSLEAIEKLEEHGAKTHFYIIPAKKFKAIEYKDLVSEIVFQDRELVYFITILRHKPQGKNELPKTPVHDTKEIVLPAVFEKSKDKIINSIRSHEVVLPKESLNNIMLLIEQKEKTKNEIQHRISGFAAYLDILSSFAATLSNSIQYDQAALYCNDDETGQFTYVEAWFPAVEESKMVQLLKSFTIRYFIADPQPGENPPVKLKNNFCVRPFESITRIFSLPSYFEMDPTPLFAPFFMLFFGLCIADAGYGILLLIFSGLALFKVPKDIKPVFQLGMIFGIFTIFAGFLINDLFGFEIFENPGNEPLIHANIPWDFFAPYKDNGRLVFPAMSFSLFIGFIQVSYGMIMQSITKWKNAGFKHAILPVAYLLMMAGTLVFAAHKNIVGFSSMMIGTLPLGALVQNIPLDAGWIILITGFVLLLFFNSPEKAVWIRPPVGLWELYGFISGIIGDILSYLRLFALGLAGGLLGNAYNNIGFLVLNNFGGWHSIMGVFFFVLIFVIGHSINIFLAVLAAFVHSLRLTFVEFYKNLQFHGGGKPFTPFSLEK
ncbi:MAG: hypothetical protein OEV66_08135 [Spirochaetia bacterium]|nr:hypothetical protein [Spirochaetia bacterium]